LLLLAVAESLTASYLVSCCSYTLHCRNLGCLLCQYRFAAALMSVTWGL